MSENSCFIIDHGRACGGEGDVPISRVINRRVVVFYRTTNRRTYNYAARASATATPLVQGSGRPLRSPSAVSCAVCSPLAASLPCPFTSCLHPRPAGSFRWVLRSSSVPHAPCPSLVASHRARTPGLLDPRWTSVLGSKVNVNSSSLLPSHCHHQCFSLPPYVYCTPKREDTSFDDKTDAVSN